MLVTSISNGNSHSQEVASKVLNGLAVGSFIFVSCVEMIPPEFHTTDTHSKYKFLVLTLGFAFMAGIAAIEPS